MHPSSRSDAHPARTTEPGSAEGAGGITATSALATKPASLGPWLLLLLLVYGWGLTSDLSKPWVGMHDWNGAFYSQLARNFRRYPLDAHWGMPLIAMGQSLPHPDERSFYSTHPPALVWLVAGSFAISGESEASARLVPILSSLLALALFVWIVFRAYGRATALAAGAFYAVMPMSVYFGRMVNHEAVCLACMMAVVAALVVLLDGADRGRGRVVAGLVGFAAMLLGVWTDWPVSLFGGLLLLWLGMRLVRARPPMVAAARRWALTMGIMIVLIVATLTTYLVFAGLDGRWGDLLAVFVSRTGVWKSAASGGESATAGAFITHTRENLTGPLLALCLLGVVMRGAGFFSRRLRLECSPGPAAQPSESQPSGDRSRVASAGLHLIGVTGLLWLVCFPRQYAMHSYWLFYLGPTAALYAGMGLCGVFGLLSRHMRSLAVCFAGAVLIVVAGAEFRGVREYFDRRWYLAPIEDLAMIHQMTRPDERILVFGDYINLEQRGAYRLRSIIPPQFAYYLDRPFAQTRSVPDAIEAIERGRLFVISKADAVRHGEALAPIRRRYVERPLGLLVVFQNRRVNDGANGSVPVPP